MLGVNPNTGEYWYQDDNGKMHFGTLEEMRKLRMYEFREGFDSEENEVLQ